MMVHVKYNRQTIRLRIVVVNGYGTVSIVVVSKPSDKIRICADLNTGVNQALDINQYPLLKPNALSVALNGRNQFKKVDFSEAYLQIELDQDCKELLILNTHKDLFRHNRLPFGVASAPNIFQQIWDEMLVSLDDTVCYLDDIIVTVQNYQDHLHNLNKVFARIQNYLLWCSRTIMSSSFRNQLFEHLHSLHSGMGRMQAAARRYCGYTENSKQLVKAPLQQWIVPSHPWQ
ncbi:unnamed protein product [Adineta steineri]|uniref:Reverse transcriptase domain-containing protein n=1 Tax=Adineta steineri TaxID=433720 RepID=A0A814FAW5_9BILA|nr:unnamed protein product [Adineta steineri]CAF1076175.1 unnamed protein product [Adineta steineri]